ncbi:MAG: glycosyltransferase family 2 protein [Candidatus Kapabacteria bacterium]|nr:glycosyltransferase family 2 protein [Candidatus Kapabacteria bacterium]
MIEKIKLSVCIITFNEEENIRRTLESVRDIADEIIIVDSNSSDSTRAIAAEFTDKIFIKVWDGFVNQKNSALKKCSGNWILSIDADEVLSDELKQSISEAVKVDNNDFSYKINRRTFYLGKFMKYAWRPDWHLRLVRKSGNPHWVGYDVHEELKCEGLIKNINGDLFHYSYNNLEHHFTKTIDYASLSALSYKKQGRSAKFFNLLINPIIAFIRLYFINKAIFDGYRGFIAALSSLVGTFLKYAFLFELEQDEQNKKN